MIFYNKQLQKLFGIIFEKIKTIYGKLKIVGINGKGEEYSLNNKIII